VKRAPLLLVAIPLAHVALVVAASLLDSRAHAGKPLRGVEVAGRSVGGLGEKALASAVDDIAADYADAPIVVHTPDGDLKTTAEAVGLTIDTEATAEAAVDKGRDDALPLRPLRWLTSLVGSHRDAGVVGTVDPAKVRDVVSEDDPTNRNEANEPGITGEDGEIAVVLGEKGKGLDADAIADDIEAALTAGDLPIELDAEPGTVEPRFTKEDAQALADKAEELTSAPLEVTAGEHDVTIPASMVRSWLRSKPGDEHLELTLDDDTVLADLATLLADAKVEPEDARISIEGGKPVILGGVVGKACCDPKAVGYLLGAVKGGLANADGNRPVDLPLTEVDPERTTEDIEKLGIVEQISTFTTPHQCCQNRVTNIHRIADLVRGQVIPPGGQFSVNGFVGRRTTENGFVVDHAIENGVFVDTVGGGISQFATTTFNAAFFGGLDLVEYQSHSIYISRYPYGREATLSFPKPDLVIGNNTPYGILIWPTYTNTSLTVTLYSTKYVHGEQTAQSEAPTGNAGCKRVTTTRTRTWEDGRTEQDKVYAVYRPAEGVQCNGGPNQAGATPETTTTTAAPPPAETTTTQAPPPDGG
jgi:vancomycin resistance protein YoaR